MRYPWARLSTANAGVDVQTRVYNELWILLAFGWGGDFQPSVLP